MALTVGTDTYISLEDANTYLADFSDGTVVTESDLKRATLALDRLYGSRFISAKTDSTQPLQFPRAGDTDIPIEVEQATAELAALISNDTNPYVQPDPLVSEESVEIDVIKQSRRFADAYRSNPLYQVTLILSPWLLASGGLRFADVVRG
jgi:hypothetical protein